MGITILLGTFLVFVVIGIPLCYSLGASAAAYFIIAKPAFMGIFAQRIWSGSCSYVLIALPLFILAGELMNNGGITRRILDFSLYLVRPIRGGLGEVNVIASMIFGGITGSSVADTSAIGSVLVPEMERAGYHKGFSAGVTVASSTMGMIIPPSIPMLLYAMVSGASVGSLFLAGLIPGILIGVSQMTLVWMISKKRGYHPEPTPFDRSDFVKTAKDGVLALLMPVIIVLSVSFGIATASESAGVAVLYAALLGFFVYRELDMGQLREILKKTVLSSSAVMFVVGFSTIYVWILSVEQVPATVGNFLLNLDVDRIWILLLLDLIILLVGTFVDVAPAILLLCPILLPVMRGIGVGELQFGAIMITGLAIGLVTPPVGMCLNACNKICRMSITDIFMHALPFILCNLLVLLLVTFVPAISTWLPALAR
ncbi:MULTISPECIES: TRAP transporter large permease [Dethiosulfovibrio]|uniref:TRAP transporter large permease n=2 Tax=Dethiosulfovibrio TaxID=47054 RepID=A0ABS9ENS2_9BACT|nr:MULTISPECIES: TRAP transporter large permease [Dethiosulfovibrio]MCF4113102.1 TRAP transporter large permease [Dethiosulfovibrio russensis]MCF4142166.1 TRAP transporter large permease [Dethiosulfovibrio marinus]MCF4145831.1 TRAP transporter large permease [Dethiosulfovibrio acidaminovorans]